MGSSADEMRSDDFGPRDEAMMDGGTDTEATGATPETEEIRADIEETRAEMTVTINAIQEKLNPENLVEQAKEQVREATIGRVEQMVDGVGDKVGEVANQAQDTAGGLMRTIRENPVPAALAAVGLGWLFTRGDSGGRSNGGAYPRRAYPSNYGYGYRADVRPGYGSYGTPGAQHEGPVERVQETVGEFAGQVGDTVGDVTSRAGDTAGDMLETIKRNPIPAALAGAGLWMLWNKRNQPQFRDAYGYRDMSYRSYGGERKIGDTIGDVPEKVGEVAGEAKDKVGEVAGQVGDRVGQVAGQVGHTAGNVAGQVGDTTGDLLGTIWRNPVPAALAGLSIAWLAMNGRNSNRGDHLIHEARNAMGERIEGAGEAVGDAAGQAQGQLQRMLYENPLVVGAAALAVGAAVGAAVPETRPEHRLMGPVRDNLMDRAQEVAQDTVDKVRQVADEVGQTVKEEAQNQGLTGDTASGQSQSGGAGYSL
jgi:hypothetical protein